MDGLMDGLDGWVALAWRLVAAFARSRRRGSQPPSRPLRAISVVGNRARAPRYGALATALLTTAALVGPQPVSGLQRHQQGCDYRQELRRRNVAGLPRSHAGEPPAQPGRASGHRN